MTHKTPSRTFKKRFVVGIVPALIALIVTVIVVCGIYTFLVY